MVYYHESKAAAEESGLLYTEHFSIKVELEPNNGWVLILKPKSLTVFNWSLASLLEIAELEFPTRVRKRPECFKKIAQPVERTAPPRPNPPPPPPPQLRNVISNGR